MEACEIPTKDMLPAPAVRVEVKTDQFDLECARKAAFREAERLMGYPRLLSWFDRRNGTMHPPDECCVAGEPSWIAYAEAHGANLTIDVNNGDYTFIFC